MKNNIIYIASRKRITVKLIQLIVFVTLFLIIYYFVHLYLDPNYKVSNGTIIGFITAFVWIVLTEERVRKLEFENEKRGLIVKHQTKYIYTKY